MQFYAGVWKSIYTQMHCNFEYTVFYEYNKLKKNESFPILLVILLDHVFVKGWGYNVMEVHASCQIIAGCRTEN